MSTGTVFLHLEAFRGIACVPLADFFPLDNRSKNLSEVLTNFSATLHPTLSLFPQL